MATLIGEVNGVIQVRPGATAENTIAIPIAFTTDELAGSNILQGTILLVATGPATQVVSFSNVITNAYFLWVRCTDTVTGNKKSVVITITGTEDGGTFDIEAADFIYSTSENPDITAVTFEGQTTGNTLRVEYIIIGI